MGTNHSNLYKTTNDFQHKSIHSTVNSQKSKSPFKKNRSYRIGGQTKTTKVKKEEYIFPEEKRKMFDMSDDDSDISINELKAKLEAQQKQTTDNLLEMEASRKAAKLRERLGQYENYGGQQVADIPSHEYIKT